MSGQRRLCSRMVLRTRLHSSALPCMNTLVQNRKVKCKKTGICTELTVRTTICICMFVPVPESPHMRRGTGVLEGVSVCPRKRKRRPSRTPSLPHAAPLEISAPCTYSPVRYPCRKQQCGTKRPILPLLRHVALYLRRY